MRSKICHFFKVVFTSGLISFFMLTSPTSFADDVVTNAVGLNYLDYICKMLGNYIQPTLADIDQQLKTLLLAFNTALTLPDTTSVTANTQNNFTNYTISADKNAQTQLDIQKQLMQDFFAGQNISPSTAPDINDYTFLTLLGHPYVWPDTRNNPNNLQKGKTPLTQEDLAYNYLRNIAGMNITHTLPLASWSGSDEDQKKYNAFYTTVTSAQTYNAYIASELYAEFINGGSFSAQQDQLIKQASDPSWFTSIASESIAVVLRQILMYLSEQLVVSSQILKAQREMVASLTMTNTLFIIGNQFNETMLLNKAKNAQPTGTGT